LLEPEDGGTVTVRSVGNSTIRHGLTPHQDWNIRNAHFPGNSVGRYCTRNFYWHALHYAAFLLPSVGYVPLCCQRILTASEIYQTGPFSTMGIITRKLVVLTNDKWPSYRDLLILVLHHSVSTTLQLLL